jgi:hypothetical protein
MHASLTKPGIRWMPNGPVRRAGFGRRAQFRDRLCKRRCMATRRLQVHECPVPCPRGHDSGTAKAPMALRRLFGLISQHSQAHSQTGNLRCASGRCKHHPSNGVESHALSLFGDQLLQKDANFFVPQRLATLNLPQSLFNFTNKPCVVINQSLNCLTHEGLRVASLLFGDSVQPCL